MARFASNGSGRQASPAGSIVFGIVWTLFSAIFVCIGLWLTWKGVSKTSWKRVPCVIERFEIRSDQKKDPVFEADLRFRYEWEGKVYIGKELWPGNAGSNDYDKVSEIREELLSKAQRGMPEGLPSECRVDPKHPESASLLPPSGAGWFGLIFAGFGGAFMLIGVSIIRGGIRARSARSRSDQAHLAKDSPVLLAVFFGLFALVGLGFTFGVLVPTTVRWLSARSWAETPGTVIWSRVKSQRGSKGGTTYSVDLFYRYQYQGREYRSNRYGLLSSSSSGRDGKQEAVDSLPPGSTLVCYVNPRKPWQAVVKRDLGAMVLFAVFPLPFLGIGIGGLCWAIRKRRAGKLTQIASVSGGQSPHREEPIPDSPELVLTAGKSRWITFFGALFICAFWNGIVSMFVGEAWSSWMRGRPDFLLTIFLIPFVLIGSIFLVYVPYSLLLAFLARYELRLIPGTLKPGGTATLTWERAGGFGQPKSIALHLIGAEIATYAGRKKPSTSTSVFHDELLAEIPLSSIFANRPIAIKLSENAVPTLKGDSNKLVWKLRMDITLRGLPKVTDEYEIDVRPLRRDELNP